MSDVAAPADSPPPPRSPWRRRLLLAGGGLLLLLGVLVLLLPSLLSSGWVTARIGKEASAAAGRFVGLGGQEVSWGETTLRDLLVRYGPGEGDPVLLRVGEIRIPAGITAAFATRYDVETLRILRPEIRIDRREVERLRTAPPATTAAPPPSTGGGASATPPPFRLKVEVRDGTLIDVGMDGRETALGTFHADLTAASDGPATFVLQADLGPRGKFRVEVDGAPFKGGHPVAPADLEARVLLVLDALDLAAFREAAALGGIDLATLEGTASARASMKVLGPALLDGKVEAALRGIVIEGEALGAGRRIAEPRLDLAAGFRRDGEGLIEVQDARVQAEGVDLRLGASLLPAGGPVNGTLEGTVELKGLLDRAKAMGISIPGDAVGELKVEARATGDGVAQRWTGTVRVRDLMVSPGRGLAPVSEPSVVLEFDAMRKGRTLRIDAGSLRSDSLALEAKGTVSETEASDLSVTGTADLARLAAMARGFGAPLKGEMAGAAALDARLLRGAPGAAGAKDEARGTLVITGLSVTPPGEGALPVREERFAVGFQAVPGEKSVDLRSLTVKGAGFDLSTAGRFDLDGGAGSFPTLEGRVDLARVGALAASFGTELPAELSGTASWKGPVSWTEAFGAVEAGPVELLVTSLVATLPAEGETPARTIREPEVRVTATLALARGEDGTAVTVKQGALRGDGVELSALGTVAADGTLDLRTTGSIGLAPATRRLLALGLLGKDPAPRGALAFDLGVKGKPEDAAVEIRRLDLEGAEADLRVTGTVSRTGPMELSATAGGGLAALLDLAARAGFGEAAPEAGGRVALRLRASASGPDSPVQVTSETSIADLSWPSPGGTIPWTQKRVVLAADGTLDRVKETVRADLSLSSDGGTVTGKAMAGLKAGARSVDAAADLDIDLGGITRARPDLLPLEPMELGRVTGKITVKGALPEPFDLRALAGTSLLHLDSVKTEAFEMKDASVDALLQGGVLRVRSVASTVNEGPVTGSALLTLAGAPMNHFLEVKAERVQVDRSMAWLLKQVVPIFAVVETGAVTGKLTFAMRLDGSGADWEAVKPNLKGKGTLEVAEGGVSGSGVVVDLLEMLGGAKSMEFRTITTEFTVKEEKIWNERLVVGGREHDMVLKGTTSFDGRLDYAVGAKFLKMKEKRLQRMAPLLDPEGNLPFGLGGTLSKPKIKPPDLEKLLGSAIKGAAEDALRKKLKELLGGDE